MNGTTTGITEVYKEEVLGRRVQVKFEVPKGKKMELKFFPGQIRKVKETRLSSLDKEDQAVEWEHYVVFEDNDKRWFDLAVLEAAESLKWIDDNDEDYVDDVEVTVVLAPSVVSSCAAIKTETQENNSKDDDVAVPDGAPSSSSSASSSSPVPQAASSSSAAPAAVVTPPPKKKQKIKQEMQQPENVDYSSDEIDIDDFEYWLRNDHDGQKGGTISDSNANSVMRQVRKLVAGDGIGYKNWPSHAIFYEDVKVNLRNDFDAMLQKARKWEAKYGEDKGHGWVLTHPIKKLLLYKEYVLKKRRSSH